MLRFVHLFEWNGNMGPLEAHYSRMNYRVDLKAPFRKFVLIGNPLQMKLIFNGLPKKKKPPESIKYRDK